MSSLLEESYRRALRLLPSGFRREWADDMVATFMDRAYRSMPDDREGVEISSPRWSELVSIARLAVRLRLGGAASVPGEVVRRIALAGMLAHVVFAFSGVALSIVDFERMQLPDGSGYASWWQVMWSMTHLLWLPAYLAVLFGHRRAAAITAVVAFVPGVVSSFLQLRADQWAHTPFQVGWLIFGALPIVALIGFHSGAPAVRAMPWVVAVPVGVVVAVTGSGLLAPLRLTGTELWAFGIIVAGLVTIAAAIRDGRLGRGRAGRGRERMSPTWPVTLGLLAAAVLGLAALSGSVGPLAIGAGAVGLVLAAMAAWARDRPAAAVAAPDGDRSAAERPPRQEPGSATTVEW
jgi:hypothetical protein